MKLPRIFFGIINKCNYLCTRKNFSFFLDKKEIHLNDYRVFSVCEG